MAEEITEKTSIRDFMHTHRRLFFRWGVTALAVAIIAAGGTYYVVSKKQTYTASVTIEYSNPAAVNGGGYLYDGSKVIDAVTGITDAGVISAGIQEAGMADQVSANELVPALTVTSVIPEDKQKEIDSILDNGKTDSFDSFTPYEYKLTLTTKFPETGKILDGIADAYISDFMNEHAGIEAMPENPTAVINNTDDYIETADLLADWTQKMDTYLQAQADRAGAFRSSDGYTYTDLDAEFKRISSEEIPQLCAKILSEKASKDPALLVQKLQAEIKQNTADSADTAANNQQTEDLIKSYSEKNKADGSSDLTGPTDSNRDTVLDDVDEKDVSSIVSSYDSLFKTYDSNADSVAFNTIQNSYDQYLIGVFEGASPLTDSDKISNIESDTDGILSEISSYYKIAESMKSESNEVMSSSCITQLNTPVAQKSLHVTLYALLAGLAGLIIMLILQPAAHQAKKNLFRYLSRKDPLS